MGRETEPHDLPSCFSAAKLWYNDASYRASSNCKREDIPITLYKQKSNHPSPFNSHANRNVLKKLSIKREKEEEGGISICTTMQALALSPKLLEEEEKALVLAEALMIISK